MAFENYQPPRFWVVAELTSGDRWNKGYRYRVRGRDGARIKTIDDAQDAIKADIEANAKPNTYGGLIDWGTASPREYAIYDLRTSERVG